MFRPIMWPNLKDALTDVSVEDEFGHIICVSERDKSSQMDKGSPDMNLASDNASIV